MGPRACHRLCARGPRAGDRAGLTLVELVVATSVALVVALSAAHVVRQMAYVWTNLERRSQVQTAAALAMQRMRAELGYATRIASLSSTSVQFAHPDVTGDGNEDTILYSWTGTPGDPLTRRVNGADAEAIVAKCVSFSLSSVLMSPQPLALVAERPYAVKLEYYERFGNAVIQLYWSSSSQAKEIIPPRRLFHLPGGGPGLKGEYYDNVDFTDLKATRADVIDFDWGTGQPHTALASNTFSIRWTGFVVPRYSQVYTFYTRSDDGVRLWIDGQLVISQWNDHAARRDSGRLWATVDAVEIAVEADCGPGSTYTPLPNPVRLRTSVACVNRPALGGPSP